MIRGYFSPAQIPLQPFDTSSWTSNRHLEFDMSKMNRSSPSLLCPQIFQFQLMVTPSFHLLKLKTLDGPRCLLVPQTPRSIEHKVLPAPALDSLWGSASPPLPWSRPYSLSLELLNSLSRIFPDSGFVPPAQSILKTTRESLLKHQSDKATLVQLCLHPSLSKMVSSGIHLHPCPPTSFVPFLSCYPFP